MEVPEDVTLQTPTYQQLHSILMEEVTTGSFVRTFVRPYMPVPGGREAPMETTSSQMQNVCAESAHNEVEEDRAAMSAAPSGIGQEETSQLVYKAGAGNEQAAPGHKEGGRGEQAVQAADPAPAVQAVPEGGEHDEQAAQAADPAPASRSARNSKFGVRKCLPVGRRVQNNLYNTNPAYLE